MAPMISPWRAGRLEEPDGVAKEPALPRSFELPAVFAGVGQQAVTHGAQGGEPAAPGPGVLLWPFQHGHGEDAGDASWAEGTVEHAIRLCNVQREGPDRTGTG